jgi:hypothetical protein
MIEVIPCIDYDVTFDLDAFGHLYFCATQMMSPQFIRRLRIDLGLQIISVS